MYVHIYYVYVCIYVRIYDSQWKTFKPYTILFMCYVCMQRVVYAIYHEQGMLM